jgi:hypothetical protein
MRLLCAAILALLLPAAASAEPERASRDCFSSLSWQGWSAPGNSNVLYLRVQPDDIYRVELSPRTRVHRYSGEFLVNQIRGSSRICSALDLDLAISDDNGFSRPLIAVDLRKLTAEEVAAIPREDLPY